MIRLVAILFSFIALSASASDRSASSCEIFVDRVMSTVGSHASRTLYVYVKTSTLLGSVREVGFYSQHTTKTYHGVESYPWREMRLDSFMVAADYFVIGLPISSDFASTNFEGAFFVRTIAGETYWAKNASDQNFVLGPELIGIIDAKRSRVGPPLFSPDPQLALSTLDPALQLMNGSACR